MPEYLFENPDTGEVIAITQGIDEEHSYSEEGRLFNRVFTVPNTSIDSNPDPFSAQQFTEKTKDMKGSMGDMWDYSAELSQKKETSSWRSRSNQKEGRGKILQKEKTNEIQREGMIWLKREQKTILFNN